MKVCQAVISFILLKAFSSVAGIDVSNINCGNICSAVTGSPYAMTCTWSGTLENGIAWRRDSSTIMTCDIPGTTCFPLGYSTGSYPNSSAAIITIASFHSPSDNGLWECRDGPDSAKSCTLPIIATGDLEGECTKIESNYNISCFGIISHGSPAATLELKVGSIVLESTTSAGSVSSTQADAAGKTYTCEMTGTAGACLTPVPVKCTETSTQTPNSTGCLCQCSCTCEQTCTIVLIITIILLVITLAVFVAFIMIFCVYNIKKYDDQYRLAVFIGAIVVCIVAIACIVVVFVLASTVEKPQADGEECCCSTCDADGEEMKNKCVGLKISAAFFCILLAVLMLIIIIIILIVWCCPGKCGTAKLLMFCNSPSAEAGQSVGNNSNRGGTPSNIVTPTRAKPKSPVEKLSDLSPGMPLPPLKKSDDAIDEEETSKDHEENGAGQLTEKKKSSKKRKKKIRSKSGEKTKKETASCPGRDSDGSAASLA